MRRYHNFRPAAFDLETRYLLSASAITRSALVHALSTGARRGHDSTIGRIEQSLNSFQADFFAAQQS